MCRISPFCTFFLMVCTAAAVSSQHLSLVTVNTSVGFITGMQEHVKLFGEDYQLNIFRGIPYAEAPVGKLRFKRPVSKARFQDGFNATAFGDGCPQAYVLSGEWFGVSFNLSTSEDCLSLNIYAPASANPSNQKPVMVFIHGGGWTIGASQQYDGRPLAAYGDVVLVTINYRLGPLGFLDTGDSNRNNGLFDELLALHWIKDNIGYFGGDAGIVTVFGESAGGVETSLHAISPLSAGRGLLHRAIPQSGAAIFPWPKHFAIVSNPLEIGKVLADSLGCTTTDTEAMVECLRSKSPEDIMEKSNLVPAAVGGVESNVWGPTVDGEFVPELPANLFTNSGRTDVYSAFSSIDVMIGSNSADGDVGMPIFEPFLPKNFSISKDLLVGLMSDFVKSVPNGADVTKALLHEYVSPVDMDGVEGRDTMIDFLTDNLFIGPAVATAQTHTKMTTDAKTYMYFFDFALNNLTHSLYRPGKVAHGLELIYLFMFPSLDITNDTSNVRQAFTDEDERFSKTMMAYWTNFAKYGNPNGNMSNPTRPKVDKEWPEFTLGNQQYLDLGSNSTDIQITARKDLRAEKMSFWLDYAPFLLNNTCPEMATTQKPSPCPECGVSFMDQQIGVLGITVGQAQTVLIVLAVCTAVFVTLSLMLLYACCNAKRKLKLLKKGQAYHANKAFESN